MTHDGAPTWRGSTKFEPHRWNFYCRSCVDCDRGGETSGKLRVTARSTTKVWVRRNFGTQFWNQFNFFGIMYIISISHHIVSYIISPKLNDFFNSTMKVELYFQLFPLMYAQDTVDRQPYAVCCIGRSSQLIGAVSSSSPWSRFSFNLAANFLTQPWLQSLT